MQNTNEDHKFDTYDFCCEVCSYAFTETIVPKILPCGHTFCDQCISKIIQQSNASCPSCRYALDLIKSHPTNYSLLKACQSQATYSLLAYHYKCRAMVLQKKITNLRDDLAKRKRDLSTAFDKVKNGVERLQSFLTSEDDDGELAEKNSVLKEIEDMLKDVGAESSQSGSYWKTRISTTISLKAFEKSTLYLEEIYSLLNNGEKVYSVHFVEDRPMYGIATVQDDMVLVHALTLSYVPGNAHVVWFDDFKECIKSKNSRLFLKANCNDKGLTTTILIETNNSSLVAQFSKLCTGELGPCYKGCSYTKDRGAEDSTIQSQESDDDEQLKNPVFHGQSFMYVKNYYMTNGREASGSIDYAKDEPELKMSNAIECSVVGWKNGSFQIVQSDSRNSGSGNVLGKVVYPLDLGKIVNYNCQNLKIIGCGIVFIFKA